ncbi:MAG: tetratricopeptide repeat protein, partial [Myxococcota bacterium]
VLRLDPTFDRARVELGGALRAKDPEAAITVLEDAIKRTPDSALAHNYLSEALAAHDQSERALVMARRATFLDDQLGRAFATLGGLEARAGNVERALAAYRRALVLDPDNAELAFKVQDLEKAAAAATTEAPLRE